MYECGTVWRRPFPFWCVALRATTSAAVDLEWDVHWCWRCSMLATTLWCYGLCVCVCRKNCLFCVLMSLRDGERLGRSGSASVSAVFFLGACACARQYCLIHLICFCALPRTLNGAPFLLPITCTTSLSRPRMCLTSKLSALKVTPCHHRYILERVNRLVRDAVLDHILK